MIASKSIVLENVLEELFSYLPEMSFDNEVTYPVSFGYGDEIELNLWLSTREENDPYPLIWLLYPFKENHTDTKLEVENVSFILAIETNNTMQNAERIAETFGKVLMPLFFNFRSAFKQANIISTKKEYELVKHPNYSKSAAREESGTIAIWDALKVTTSFTVMDTCLREIKF